MRVKNKGDQDESWNKGGGGWNEEYQKLKESGLIIKDLG